MILSSLDLTQKLDTKEYNEQLEEYQLKLLRLQRKLYEKEIPLILVFEGWDASGKGGAIKRVTESLDPRGFQVHPIAAPSEDELKHHYMWRFWTQFPKKGAIGIFDRSWYGRVLVERVEGFANPEEWQRAYDEINHTEKMLNDDGAYILKFWLHISAEEQLKRFKERENNPLKNWKITKEDWRNREKRPEYEEAVEEMIRKTHSPFAPWHLIEAENKKYARIKILKTIVHTLE
ncbi:UDP-galactose-lipid carrier transferase [Brevibacillus fluminis]|uniref:UDP-galactose-lipid carrier transferase n=1 Tax=Brevibacillus fluminis TaxID=511487 RepID=A0A3M8DF48_9BACL|nr:UDP-galactose-lipid carrier transferase [Brevibacillus fluminis]RNB85827.1 UDP-galactose-lipid carrier transferase [Brevibacillus fluminis]